MQSRNKPAQTALQKRYVGLLAEQPCVICGASPVDVHEFEQGYWFTSVPLCRRHHTDNIDGWHGQRQAWTLARMDMLKAIDVTVGRVFKELLR